MSDLLTSDDLHAHLLAAQDLLDRMDSEGNRETLCSLKRKSLLAASLAGREYVIRLQRLMMVLNADPK
jgi:hypothetical protein